MKTKYLKRFCFDTCIISDQLVGRYIAHKALEELEFCFCYEVTGECLNSANLSNIKSLAFKTCVKLQATYTYTDIYQPTLQPDKTGTNYSTNWNIKGSSISVGQDDKIRMVRNALLSGKSMSFRKLWASLSPQSIEAFEYRPLSIRQFCGSNNMALQEAAKLRVV